MECIHSANCRIWKEKTQLRIEFSSKAGSKFFFFPTVLFDPAADAFDLLPFLQQPLF